MFSRNKQGERRLSPSLYKLLLTAHVIVSVGWLGVTFAKLFLKLVAMTTSAPDVAAALYFASERLNLGFPPLAIGTLATGVLLSLGTKWGLLQHYWVATKLALTVGVIVTAVQLGTRIPRPDGVTPAGWTVADGTILGIPASPAALLLALSVIHLLMLAIATVISEYKPWGKTWFGRRKAVQPRVGHAILSAKGRAASAYGGQHLGEPVE